MPKMKSKDTLKGRWYTTPDGKEYPSVTSILGAISKPALMNWAAKVEREMVVNVSAQLYQDMHSKPKMTDVNWKLTLNTMLGNTKAANKELAKAAEIGSQAHALIEWTMMAAMLHEVGPAPEISGKARWAFSAWENWKASVNLKPVFVEQTVWSNIHQYAGTMDLLAYVNDQLTVVDWKTGKAIYPEAYLQNAAYRHAIREMGHADPVAGLIVRLPKSETDPEFEVKECPPEKECMDIFLSTRKLWAWIQENDTYGKKETAA